MAETTTPSTPKAPPAKPTPKTPPSPKPAATPKPAPAPKAEETAPESNGESKKAECPITKTQWNDSAPVAVQTGNIVLNKKEFATGTLGYFAQISVTVMIDGVPVKMNGNAQVYVANSKNAKE